MPKILYIVTKSDWGGAQKYVFDLSKTLKNKCRVVVAAGQGTGELFEKLNRENIRFFQLKHLKRLPSLFGTFLVIKEIKNLIKKEMPDILHLNSTTAGFFGSIAGKIAKRKPRIVYTVHGWAFLEPGFLKKTLFYFFEKSTSRLKNKFIVLSSFERKKGAKIAKPEKMTIIPNGIERLSFLSKEEARAALGLDAKKPVVGVVANPYKTKGLEYLLSAYPEAVIIGEGPEKKKLQKKFPKGLFLGAKKDAFQFIRAFDVFCLPSVKEGFPFVILEAMQAIVPIVAAKIGALPEIIENNQSGLLVEPKNAKELREKIWFLLKNQEKSQAMARRANEKARQFTLEKMAKATMDVYRQLLRERINFGPG